MLRLYETLISQSYEVTVVVHGEKIDRKDHKFSEITSHLGAKTQCIFGEEPDKVAKDFASKNNCVIFDSPETERVYSKSFHLYANSMMQVLDLVELNSVLENRKQAYVAKKSPADIAATAIDFSVDVLY